MKKLALLIGFLFMISCDDKPITGIDNTDLIGDWNWTETNGGIAAHIHDTPDSLGKNYILQLNSNYTFSILENENEVLNGSYQLKMVESIYSSNLERSITLQPHQSQTISGVVLNGIIKTYENGTKLEIDDNMYDGIGSSFEKIF